MADTTKDQFTLPDIGLLEPGAKPGEGTQGRAPGDWALARVAHGPALL